MADERQQTPPDAENETTPETGPAASGDPRAYDPKEMEGLSPAERAAIYKARQRQAGMVPPGQGEQPAAKAPAPAPKAEGAPPAKPAGGVNVDPKELEGLSPKERAAIYKARQREAGFTPPQRAQGEDAAAPAPSGKEAAAPANRQPAPPKPTAPATAAKSAAPGGAKPAAPKPDKPAEPEVDPEEVIRLRAIAPDLTWERVHGYAEVTIPADKLLAAARLAKEQLGYDYLSAITAVDMADHFLMIYHLYSFDYQARSSCLVLQVKLPREASPSLDSLTSLWPGADFQEREVWDLMGVRFLGHPDLRRILLADDFPGHPLRKDFNFDYEYVLVRHLRHGVEGQDPVGYAPPHEQVNRSMEHV